MSGSSWSCGVSTSRTSVTGANADTMRLTGAVTEPPAHVVRMDIESLPTGMAMPNAGQSSRPTALTMS